MAGRRIVVEFLGKDKNLGKTLGGVEGKTSSLGGKLAKFGKVAAAGLAVGGAAAVVVGKRLIDAGERASTANARIENVADSMGLFGKKAGEVSDRLVDLANKTAIQTGMDQNSIKETQAKLLTFKELARSADDAGGAFDRTTQAAIDLEAAGFGPAQQQAVQLGKAMNDPIRGLTALRRNGIQFTEQQEKQIATMVESGKQGKAQAMILKEIERQVGGTAVATANGTDKIKVAFSQVEEKLGQKLLPLVNRFADWFIEKGIPAIEDFAASLQKTLGPILKKLAPIIKSQFKVIVAIFKTFGALLRGDWKGVWKGLQDILKGAVGMWKAVLKLAFQALGAIARTGGELILRGIKAIPGQIKRLGPLFKAAGRWLLDSMLDGLKHAAGFIGGLAGSIWNAVKGLLNGAIDKINSALEFTIKLPGPDIHINPPNIPHLAKGGIVTKPTLAMIGEDGAEAVVPLTRKHAPKGGLTMSGGDVVHVHFHGPVLGEGRAAVDYIISELKKHKRQRLGGGALGLT